MEQNALLARLDRLESIEEIRQLAGKYSLSLDMRALDDMRLQGVKTTAAYYQEILRNPEFRSGQFNTSFVESHPELTNYSIKRKPEELALAIAAAIAAHAGL